MWKLSLHECMHVTKQKHFRHHQNNLFCIQFQSPDHDHTKDLTPSLTYYLKYNTHFSPARPAYYVFLHSLYI